MNAQNNDYALLWASMNGHLDVVKILIESGIDLHALNESGYILLQCIINFNGSFETIKLLLEHGADIHKYNNDILIVASKDGHSEIMNLLLDYGADIHADDRILIFASQNNHLEIVKILTGKDGTNIFVLSDFINQTPNINTDDNWLNIDFLNFKRSIS